MKTIVDPSSPAFFLSADWSKEAGKRSVHVADIHERRIRYAECGGWNLAKLLASARERVHRGPVLIGIDLAIGLPGRYWRALLHSGMRQDLPGGARRMGCARGVARQASRLVSGRC